jgi:hypothetical protein
MPALVQTIIGTVSDLVRELSSHPWQLFSDVVVLMDTDRPGSDPLEPSSQEAPQPGCSFWPGQGQTDTSTPESSAATDKDDPTSRPGANAAIDKAGSLQNSGTT